MPQPLRPTDPPALGPYHLLGRLGEGGMGTVYLGRTPAGRLVAVKVIRAEYAPDDEFRRRFRSEVNRARQVPPFCTAEVLDADPDHERPYLVVEYVDGPSLADVVSRQGPLSAGSLHSVAIGVATALTAIHGAGVIHRDLKPGNVLFGLGSPKVIDFGIARAMEMTSQHTRTDQMVGTVSYMAPERFDDRARTVTAAADIFAWGGVVMYAGTGRTPFAADSPPATAARILTQPPDLTGLSGPLRDLVGLCLVKDPDERPTARELLDLLLTAGPQGAPVLAAGLDERPALRRAAEAARANGRPSTGDQSGHYQSGQQPLVSGTAMQGARPAARPGRWAKRLGFAAAIVAALVGLGVAVWAVTIPGGENQPSAESGPAVEPSAESGPAVEPSAESGPAVEPSAVKPSAAGVAPVPAGGQELVVDPLTEPDNWVLRTDTAQNSSCSFDGALVVVRRTAGTYRCPGLRAEVDGDHRITVDVTVDSAHTCASVWFLFSGTSGYRLRACPEAIDLGTHKGTDDRKLESFTLSEPFKPGVRRRLTIDVKERIARLSLDGASVGRVPLSDESLSEGRVVLGVHTDALDGEADYRVTFADVQIVTFE